MSTPESDKNAKEVIVTLDDASMSRIGHVAEQLAAKGLKVTRKLDVIGQIHGMVHDLKKCQLLREVPGVVGVEVSRSVQLPPPDSSVQ